MSDIQTPSDARLLYALEVPAEGGQTGFSNLYVAFDAMRADLKALAVTILNKQPITAAARCATASTIRVT